MWKVGGPKGKVFAIGWFDGPGNNGITFKCSDISFDMLKEAEGCIPAPYLASRGMKWIQRVSDVTLSDADLKLYLRESHKLAAANLTKKQRLEAGLTPT